MKYIFLILIMCVALLVFAESPDVASLVQVEKDFSNVSVKKGVNESFVTYFADDAVILRPGPVNGKKWYQGRPQSSGQLSWEPSLSEISASGELGYNTGPWEFRTKAEDPEPAGHGQFFSFWKKQPDGKWKVAIDHGHENSKPPKKATLVTILPQKSKGSSTSNARNELKLLMIRDREFSKMSKAQGTSEAYKQFLAKKTRVMRAEHLPESDREKALAMISQEKGSITWEPSGGDVAASGDLGYTYGLSERTIEGKLEKGNYVRAWRNENGQWKVAVELMTPIPD